MGSGLSVSCSKCPYSERFLIGVGMAHSGLEDAVAIEDLPDRERILEILSHRDASGIEFAHAVHGCPSCSHLARRFHVRLEHGRGEVYETRYACTRCGGDLEVVEEAGLRSWPCPECGSPSLSSQVDLLWD